MRGRAKDGRARLAWVTPSITAMLGKATDAVVAAAAGVVEATVSDYRRKLGIASFRATKPPVVRYRSPCACGQPKMPNKHSCAACREIRRQEAYASCLRRNLASYYADPKKHIAARCPIKKKESARRTREKTRLADPGRSQRDSAKRRAEKPWENLYATRRWRLKNPEKAADLSSNWRAANPEKVQEYRRNAAKSKRLRALEQLLALASKTKPNQ